MYNHEPKDYECPYCALVAGGGDELSGPEDVVYQDDDVTVFVAPKWWPNNPGNVLVIPNIHVENLYDAPDETLAKVYAMVKRVAIALKKAYGCDATSTRQHNEPDGNQKVWHLHVHVFPRWANDRLYQSHDEARWASAEEKREYAMKLRAAL